MIGVVGPRDSVARVLEVAASIDMNVPMKARTYERIDSAGEATRAIARSCDYVLFTGQAAYAIARSEGALGVPVDYVDYTAADIARALFVVAQENGGSVPPFSIDGFDANLIRTTCEDLGVVVPTQLMELSEDLFLDDASLDRVTEFHRSSAADGSAAVALTCLGAVKEALEARGRRVYRVSHTQSAIRSALERARDSIALARSRQTQIVVGLIRFEAQDTDDSAEWDSLVEHFAVELRGTSARIDKGSYRVHSTAGSFQDSIRPGERGRVALRRLQQAQAQIGFGIETTAAGAEYNAGRAARMPARHQSDVYLIRPDGTAQHVLDGSSVPLREVSPDLRRLAKELGLGPQSLRRLVMSLDRLDPDRATVRDVANAYGVSPRTARRMLASLRDRNLASEIGVEATPGPGRPQMVYRLDSAALHGYLEDNGAAANAPTGSVDR